MSIYKQFFRLEQTIWNVVLLQKNVFFKQKNSKKELLYVLNNEESPLLCWKNGLK